MSNGILVAGIGNILLGDDGFGVEVANRLASRTLLPTVRVAEYGIRGVHLAYELLDGYDALVLVDAVPMHEPPGTLAVIEPDAGEFGVTEDGLEPVIDAHSMSPAVVLSTFARLGGNIDRIVVVGCQPGNLDEGIGLSPPVAAVIDDAVDLCLEVVSEIVEHPKKEGDQ